MKGDNLDHAFAPKQKFRRRKKVTEDASQNWDQSETIRELEDAKRRGRLLCKRCHKHKPWSKLELRYERVGNQLQMVWYCPDCGNALLTQDTNVKFKRKKGKKKKRVATAD